MTKPIAEIARLFEAEAVGGANFGGEVYPGYPGLVVLRQAQDELLRQAQEERLPEAQDNRLPEAQDERPGRPALQVRTMTWGFPLALKGRDGRALKPKAVTNAREDKLTTPFWRPSLAARRCLVPVTAWAEAEGPKGRMTRTWYALPASSCPRHPRGGGDPSREGAPGSADGRWAPAFAGVTNGGEGSPANSTRHPREGGDPAREGASGPTDGRWAPAFAGVTKGGEGGDVFAPASVGEQDKGLSDGEVFAVAGLWRPTVEWGDAYAMVMCDSCSQMAEVHDRMPVLLPREQWDAWLGGSPEEAIALCRTWPGELLVEQTREKWAGGGEIDCAPEPGQGTLI